MVGVSYIAEANCQNASRSPEFPRWIQRYHGKHPKKKKTRKPRFRYLLGYYITPTGYVQCHLDKGIAATGSSPDREYFGECREFRDVSPSWVCGPRFIDFELTTQTGYCLILATSYVKAGCRMSMKNSNAKYISEFYFFLNLTGLKRTFCQVEAIGTCNDPIPSVPYFRSSFRLIGHVPSDDLFIFHYSFLLLLYPSHLIPTTVLRVWVY